MESQAQQPYAPPASDVELDEPQEMILAGRGRRFGTLMVDYVGFMVIGALFGVVMGILYGAEADAMLAKIPDLAMGIIMLLVYYVFFEGIWGRTPGKLVFGTVVVNEDGRKPSLGQILGRTLARCIPFEPLTFFGERGLHDRMSSTRVVRVRGR